MGNETHVYVRLYSIQQPWYVRIGEFLTGTKYNHIAIGFGKECEFPVYHHKFADRGVVSLPVDHKYENMLRQGKNKASLVGNIPKWYEYDFRHTLDLKIRTRAEAESSVYKSIKYLLGLDPKFGCVELTKELYCAAFPSSGIGLEYATTPEELYELVAG